MARKGYNSDWQYKRFAAEVSAARTALRAGKPEEAAAALERADFCRGQMDLFTGKEVTETTAGSTTPRD